MDEIGIVTDSTADLPPDVIEKYDIQVVPNLIILNGESLQDGVDLTREDFYTRLPLLNPPPTTATASSGAYQHAYEILFRRGARMILSIHPPNNLSGIFNAASIAAQAFGERIHVVDSGQLTMGEGFQVLAAAEAIRQGMGIDTVISMLENMQHRTLVVAMLDTLEYVRRSGRVSWARARLGNLLQIKPFVELKHGVVSSLGESRTRTKGIQRLHELLRRLGKLERLAILHTNAEADAIEFLHRLELETEITPFLVNVTTVIGTHVGPNGLGFAAVRS